MRVLVICEDHICGDEELMLRVEGVVAGTLQRFSERILRVGVHLSDLRSERPGDRDKICRLEVRLADAASLSKQHAAPTLTEAIHVAADELQRLVGRELRQLTRALAGVAAAQSPAGH